MVCDQRRADWSDGSWMAGFCASHGGLEDGTQGGKGAEVHRLVATSGGAITGQRAGVFGGRLEMKQKNGVDAGGVFSLRSLAGFLTITWGAGTGCLGLGRRRLGLVPHSSAPSVVPVECGADGGAQWVAGAPEMAAICNRATHEGDGSSCTVACIHRLEAEPTTRVVDGCKPCTQPAVP